MKTLRNKQDILTFTKKLEGIQFPDNVYISIIVKDEEFDELVLRGIGKAIDINTIHCLNDDKVYKIVRLEKSDKSVMEDYSGPKLFL